MIGFFYFLTMTKIIKSKLHRDYSIVPNEILRRPDITAKAKGLFCYLNSLPDDWVIFKKEVQKHFKDGRDSIDSAFKELEKHGYLVGADQINNGLFSGKDYVLYQYPFGVRENAENPHPDTENPTRPMRKTRNGTDAENPQLLNTNKRLSTKETKESPTEKDVIEYFLSKGYSEQSAKRAYEYYSIANWKDSKGNQVKNWKQKMIAVWFKPENEIKKQKGNPYGL